ncbi:MAG: MBL fold metallo-hydrolase [Synergistaceae bacterium]|nr:MBL fold metallo-hydrolase [Synergistaceae bacterium]
MERTRQRGRRILGFIIFIVILLLSAFELPRFFNDGVTFYAFDVGQGDSLLFHFPDGSNMLVDAGTRKSARSLVSKLRKAGVKNIDILVATHPHEDHIGGMELVLKSFSIGKIWDSGYNHGSSVQASMLQTIRELGIRFGRPRAGLKEEHGGAVVEVIAPVNPISGSASDANNNSIVLRVSYGSVSFLLMGDIEREGRGAIKKFQESAILKVSHHGSSNGTDRRLLDQVKPKAAILSYGRGNSYGHPHKEVTRLLERFSVTSYATVDGDIKITTDGNTYSVSQESNR